MVFENPNDRALLEAELEKYGIALKWFEDAVDSVVPAISQVAKMVVDVAAAVGPILYDAILCTVGVYPKYYHYYKHAKKFRTRKKYRNRLWKIATAAIEKQATENRNRNKKGSFI